MKRGGAGKPLAIEVVRRGHSLTNFTIPRDYENPYSRYEYFAHYSRLEYREGG